MTEEAPKQSAAASTAEKVRAILEAAERSAAELEAEAREDAARVRAEADSRLTRAREVAARLAERAGELERQVADIRASIASLAKELEDLRGAAPSAEAALRESEPVASLTTEDAETDMDETIAAAEAAAARDPDVAEGADAAGRGEGARVIALNMALRGAPRAETARYLAENFELDDPDALLDDVYARAGSG